MPHSLFDPVQLGDLPLRNRIAMAPLTRNRARGNVPNALTATYYGQRASAGLIISEGTPISQQGQGYADVPGLYQPEQLAGWQGVTEAVHAQGGTIFAQLWHVGRVSHTSLQPAGGAPVAPSALTAEAKTYLVDAATGAGSFAATSAPRALLAQELPGIVADFAQAARHARQCGFDGVEIHGANGYLLDQFLKDGSNQRDDAWGGSIENRSRFAIEVAKAVAAEIGAFVDAMIGSQSNQLKAFVSFVGANNSMKKAIIAKDWATFARLYNGPDYAKNNYDTKMKNEYDRLVRAAKATNS